MKAITYTFLLILIFFCSTLSSGQTDSAKVDSTIHAFMHKWDLPGGSFTMAFNRTIIYSKGYGFADVSGMDSVKPQSLFRIASCTKPFTAVGIMQLIQEGRIKLTDTVFGPGGILNQPQYQNILDSNVLNITVENLLEHTGGWDDSYQPDPMFYAVEIAEWANIPSPPMQETIIEYVLSQMKLIHTPGAVYAYSNFGFCVLGRVIEKVTGQVYKDYIREKILIPSGTTSMQQGKSLLSGRYPNEVHYYGCPGEMTGPSVYDTTATVPWPYGAFNIEAMDSHGDWIASSNDLVKFLLAVHEDRLISQHTYNVMITPPAVNQSYAKGWAVNDGNIFHVGSLPGTVSEIVKATNGYMWALVFNKRSLNDTIFNDLDDLGWNIQQFIVPTIEDSCTISGPDLVAPNHSYAYHSAIPTQTWEVYSYDGADASIDSISTNNIYVNSGPTAGKYTIYKIGGDSNQLVLCSLNVTIDPTLPVEMETFTFSINANDVDLFWTTSSEINNYGYDIERLKFTGVISTEWKKIGFVPGSGTTNSSMYYNYKDKGLESGKYKYRIKQVDLNGNYEYLEMSGEVFIGAPKKYFLSENYPNPFNPVTKISFDIPERSPVTLKIYDVNGREVGTLVNETKEAGFYTVSFDASSLSSGVYFYRMISDDFVMARKMLLLK